MRFIPMKKLFIFVFVFLLACSRQADFYYLDGSEGYIEKFNDKWIMLNFWAEWCKPCIEEIPEINEFFRDYGNTVAVLGINFDGESVEMQRTQQARWSIEYPLVTQFPLEHYGVDMPGVLPINIIVSPDGKVAKILKGPQTVKKLTKAFDDLGVNLGH